MNGNAQSLGRNILTATKVALTDFGDCARVMFTWDDGAMVYHLFDTKGDALAYLTSLGYSPKA